MRRRYLIPALTLFSLVLLLLGALDLRAPTARAVEQGTITVKKTWAANQKPNEVVEVCFVVTSDADGTDVLGKACTTDETYTVTFGPSDPALQTGVVYYVWEDVGAGWAIKGDNPVSVTIPDTSGTADVSFENQHATGTATITIHKAVCPETNSDLFGTCHDKRVPDVHFSIASERVVTDKHGVATAKVASGSVQITEADADFADNASAGAAYVYCAVQPDKKSILFDDHADHRSVTIDVPAGATVICDWYDLTAGAAAKGELEIHKRVCPNGEPTGDIFQQCHGFPPQQPVSFTVNGGTAKFVDEQGNVIFSDLAAGDQAVQLTEGPPLEAVRLAIWCSVQGSNNAPFQVQPNGPNFTVSVGQGEHVICDVYDIGQNLSGQTPTTVPVATNTPTSAAPPPATETSTVAPPPPPTETSTPMPPTATPTETATPLPPTPTPTPTVSHQLSIQAGICAELSGQPRYELKDLIEPTGGVQGSNRATVVEASYTLVNVSLDDLLSSDFAVTVHASQGNAQDLIACGEVGGPFRSDGSIVVGLREQGGSGLTGIVYLLPDSSNPNRTGVSAFLAPGLAEEDPTLKPASANAVVIHSVVDNGPVAPAAQEGYDITVFGSGRVEIVITPPGASEALGNQTTAEKQTRTVTLTDTELTKLLTDLQTAGYFGLTQADRINPKAQVTGGVTSVLTVSLVDGEWKVNGNGLSQDEAATLEKAQAIVADAVGGVQLP